MVEMCVRPASLAVRGHLPTFRFLKQQRFPERVLIHVQLRSTSILHLRWVIVPGYRVAYGSFHGFSMANMFQPCLAFISLFDDLGKSTQNSHNFANYLVIQKFLQNSLISLSFAKLLGLPVYLQKWWPISPNPGSCVIGWLLIHASVPVL